MARTNYLKPNSSFFPYARSICPGRLSTELYKDLDFINYGKQAAVFTENLVHALNITFYGY